MTTTTLSRPVYKRGDVVLVLFLHSDLRTAKPRPALVVQADNLQTSLSQVVIAMITSKLFRANHPSRVLVSLSMPEGQQSGLLTDSVVMTDNLATIAEAAIERVIGTLPMREVDKALRHTLGLGA
jgi:mRNA interferase MazF